MLAMADTFECVCHAYNLHRFIGPAVFEMKLKCVFLVNPVLNIHYYYGLVMGRKNE